MFPKSFRNGGECCPRLETASWKSNGASFSNNLIHCYSTILLIFPLLPPSLVSFTQNETKTRHVLYLKKKRNKNSRYFLYTLFISQKNKLQSFNKILKQISFRVNFNQSLSVNPFYILSVYVSEKISQSLNSLKIRFNGKKKINKTQYRRVTNASPENSTTRLCISPFAFSLEDMSAIKRSSGVRWPRILRIFTRHVCIYTYTCIYIRDR